MKKWCAEHGVLNGSVAHARKRCVAAIVARLNAERAAKMQAPNPALRPNQHFAPKPA